MGVCESVLEYFVKRADASMKAAERLGKRNSAKAIKEAQGARGDYKIVTPIDFLHLYVSLISDKLISPGEKVLVRRASQGVAFSYQLQASLWHETGMQGYNANATGGLEAKTREAFENCFESCNEAVKAFGKYKAFFTTDHELANRELRLREVYALAVDVCLKLASDYYTRAVNTAGENISDPARLGVRQLLRIGKWVDRAVSKAESVSSAYRSAEKEGIVLQPNYRAQAERLAADAKDFGKKLIAAVKAQAH